MSERTLLVSLEDVVVGHLWGDGSHSLFSFHQSYLDSPNRPVLGQYFEDRLQKTARRVRRMHPWFENALPERAGALRNRLSRMLELDASDSMALLSAVGGDLPGAVRVRPDDGGSPLTDVIDEARPHGRVAERFSLGGMQLKFSMSGEPERLSVGVSDEAGLAWILKLGTLDYPELAENEHAIMSWCRTAGLDVPETRVIAREQLPNLGAIPNTPTGYLVRRYDRAPGRRIHQEDFCQVLNLPPDRKYNATSAAGLFGLARQILGASGAEEALRRLVVVVATGNCDAHLKNWSLVYADGMTPLWSPLYDQVSTVAYPQVPRTLALRIGTASHLHEVTLEHLRWVGTKGGLTADRCDDIIDRTLREMAEAFTLQTGIPPALAAVLQDLWRTVPLLQAYQLG